MQNIRASIKINLKSTLWKMNDGIQTEIIIKIGVLKLAQVDWGFGYFAGFGCVVVEIQRCHIILLSQIRPFAPNFRQRRYYLLMVRLFKWREYFGALVSRAHRRLLLLLILGGEVGFCYEEAIILFLNLLMLIGIDSTMLDRSAIFYLRRLWLPLVRELGHCLLRRVGRAVHLP